MARKKPVFEPRKWWRCEECGTAHEGLDPPDECTWCGARYFGNLADEPLLWLEAPPMQD